MVLSADCIAILASECCPTDLAAALDAELTEIESSPEYARVAAEAECHGCDGSGYYTPAFSPTALVDCQVCNADWHKPPPGVATEQWASEEWWDGPAGAASDAGGPS